MTAPTDTGRAITLDDLRGCRMREILHGHGAKGMWIYGFVYVEHPRMRKFEKCPKRGAKVEFWWTVDGVRYAEPSEVVEALNQPHDLAGIARRMEEATYHDLTVEYIDGKLMVRGESAKRCTLLTESFPSFEGVPVEWVSPAKEDIAGV